MVTSQLSNGGTTPLLPDRFDDPERAAAVLDQRGTGLPSVATDLERLLDHHGTDTPGARDGRGLMPTAWLKALWVLLQTTGLALTLTDPRIGVMVLAASWPALMLWSALAAMNVRRARPRTVYRRPPLAIVAALAWLAPVVVIGTAVAVSWWLEGNAETLGAPGEGGVGEIRATVGLAAVIPGLIALYLPFAVLGRATAWAGGRRGHWRTFFLLPTLGSLLAGLLNTLLSAVVPGDGFAAASADSNLAALTFFLGLVLLPLVLHWLLGWRAMSETERASAMTWERRNFPEGEFDLSDGMVARAAVAAYLSAHPEG